ncbi:MAG: hypothetical protein NWP83_05785, partial [Spirosomaceae bacterium]|nr:hypothetical protein [Spirosomataceae bacterium]
MNLFEQFDELMTDKLVEKTAELANDASNNSYKSLKGIFYTLVAGLIRRGSSTMSSNMLYSQIQRSGKKGGLVNSIDDITSNNQLFEVTVASGSKTLSQIFPAFKSPLISMVSTYAETPKPSAVAYSGFLSALLVDMLDQRIEEENLSADGLASLLQSHHQPLFSESPYGLLEIMIPALGMQELRNEKFIISKKNPQREDTEADTELQAALEPDPDYDDLARRRGVSATSLIGIGVVVVGIALFAWWYLNMRQSPNISPAVEEVATEVPLYESDSVVTDSSINLPATENVVEGEFTSFGQELITYINDATAESGKVIPFNSVQFLNLSKI